MRKIIAGIDLSGPSNLEETVLTVAVSEGKYYRLDYAGRGLNDPQIAEVLSEYCNIKGEFLTVGIDAPLSYNQGGGDRPGDRELRNLLKSRGLMPGTVMPPTLTKMVYLTLRGISLARFLNSVIPGIKIAEVHPAGSLVLNGFDPALVKEMKRSENARLEILAGLEGIFGFESSHSPADDHYIASLGALLAARGLADNNIRWIKKAEPPLHPFDFAC